MNTFMKLSGVTIGVIAIVWGIMLASHIHEYMMGVVSICIGGIVCWCALGIKSTWI